MTRIKLARWDRFCIKNNNFLLKNKKTARYKTEKWHNHLEFVVC